MNKNDSFIQIWKRKTLIQNVQFEFEAIASVADNGHIALDDILYQEDTECQDTHHDNCDFQNGFCRWTNQQPEIGSWIVTSNEQSGDGPRLVRPHSEFSVY